MTTAIGVEDVRREVKIMKALSGHKHMIKFHDAFEDAHNVYIVMECVSLFCTFILKLIAYNVNQRPVTLLCHTIYFPVDYPFIDFFLQYKN